MKIFFLFSFVFLGIYETVYADRNPFEFTDEQCKHYSALKIENRELIVPEQQQKWKISETKSNTTHIVQDKEGNVRTVSMEIKN